MLSGCAGKKRLTDIGFTCYENLKKLLLLIKGRTLLTELYHLSGQKDEEISCLYFDVQFLLHLNLHH